MEDFGDGEGPEVPVWLPDGALEPVDGGVLDGEGEVPCGGAGGDEFGPAGVGSREGELSGGGAGGDEIVDAGVGVPTGALEGDGVEAWGDVEYGDGEIWGDENGVGEFGDKAVDGDIALGGYAIGP